FLEITSCEDLVHHGDVPDRSEQDKRALAERRENSPQDRQHEVVGDGVILGCSNNVVVVVYLFSELAQQRNRSDERQKLRKGSSGDEFAGGQDQLLGERDFDTQLSQHPLRRLVLQPDRLLVVRGGGYPRRLLRLDS